MATDRGTRGERLTGAIRGLDPSSPVFLLSEVKVRSPRDGELLAGRDPAATARAMVDAGADGVSVVTEPEHFGGSLGLLESVAAAVDVPVLAKDFVTTREDVDRLRDRGADAVLLIASELPEEALGALYRHCLDAGVDPLVETHTEDEVAFANDLGAPLVGVNNRDIGRLERDDGGVERTESLAPLVRDDALVVSESSLSSPAEVARAVAAGADAALVGTAVLAAPDVEAPIRAIKSMESTGP
jgi:indole-3-glycerol phosphate synthase